MINDEQLVPLTSPGRACWEMKSKNQAAQYLGESYLMRVLARSLSGCNSQKFIGSNKKNQQRHKLPSENRN